MYRTKDNNNKNSSKIIRGLVEEAEIYNQHTYPNNSSLRSNDDVTEQILFCQNGIDNLNIASKQNNPICVSKKFYSRFFYE
jgi:hypothetical protein